MSRLSRRTFLTGTFATGAALALPHSRVLGANEDIRVAVVGFNGQGASHIGRLAEMHTGMKGVRLVALCDVDPAVIAKQVASLGKKGITVETFTDVRKLLEKKDLDAITTATPNHWHS